jgi:hypothetical protein
VAEIPEQVQLPPAPGAPRALGPALPWRVLAALLAPVAALGGSAGLWRWIDGPVPQGDSVLRWLWLASALGLLLCGVAGLWLAARASGRALWAAWGAAGPWAAAALALFAVRAVRPLRDAVAARQEASCRARGRTACTLNEFLTHCRSAGQPGGDWRALGPPSQELCGPDGCTRRFVYAGPWTPDNWVMPGSLICSVVADARGAPVRATTSPGAPQR